MSHRLLFASDAIVRFRDGRILIHANAKAGVAAPPTFQTDQPALMGWLAQFAVPVELAPALRALPEPARALAQRAVAFLQGSGALVAAGSAGADPMAVETAHARSRDLLPALSQDLYQLACDVLGFGPYAEAALRERTGLGLHHRLETIHHAVGALHSELQTLRAPYLSQQLRALGVGPQMRELQLHIGCGPCHLPGWVNLDIHPAPLATNVQWGLPFADGSVRRVFLSHLLEHLFYPNDVAPFLAELARVLAPGGVVRIVVPDIEQCIEAYRQDNRTFFDERRQHWGAGDGAPTRLENFLAYAGAGPDPAYVFEAHKFGYDFETLAKALERAGFGGIERSDYMGSRHAELQVDCHSAVASANYGGRYYSLFVEASKLEGDAA